MESSNGIKEPSRTRNGEEIHSKQEARNDEAQETVAIAEPTATDVLRMDGSRKHLVGARPSPLASRRVKYNLVARSRRNARGVAHPEERMKEPW